MRTIVPITLLVVLVSLFAAGSAAVQSPADPDLVRGHENANIELAVPEPDCDFAWTEEAILASQVYQQTFAHYAERRGFIDLHFANDVPHHFVALFDAGELEEAAAPAALELEAPFTMEVQTLAFESLVADLVPTAPPMVPQTCSGRLSPGASMSSGGIGCTANFLFEGSNGKKYIGSAGHCYGVGRQVTVGGVYQAATVVWRMGGGLGNDFEVLEIDPAHYDKIDPAMCHWGGPEQEGNGGSGGVLRHYGYGLGYGSTQFTRPRSGLGMSSGSTSFAAVGTVVSGDSGSAARQDDGDAHGIITHVNVPLLVAAHSGPYFYGTKISHAINSAEAALGIDLTLMTAPNA